MTRPACAHWLFKIRPKEDDREAELTYLEGTEPEFVPHELSLDYIRYFVI